MIVMKFKSGESRTINPAPQFFVNKDGDRMSPGELSKVIKNIIDDNGSQNQCYECYFTMGSKHINVIENRDNINPNAPRSQSELDSILSQRIIDLIAIKLFKKELKNYKFTQKIVRNLNGVFVTKLNNAA